MAGRLAEHDRWQIRCLILGLSGARGVLDERDAAESVAVEDERTLVLSREQLDALPR
jgi:hypothetical protein